MPENLNYTCPICHSPLSKIEKSFRCDNNHNFDIAKQGYVNLLPVQHKKSKNPGDNKLMVRMRRDFLNKNYYDILLNPCINFIKQYSADPISLLDIGCGDGYFTQRIFSSIEYEAAFALDISNEALKIAAKRDPNIQWSVASNRAIPLPDNSISAILKVNTPANLDSSNKVLRPNGIIINVSPGPRHLEGLKKVLYDTPQQHKTEPTPAGYVLKDSSLLTDKITLDNKADIQALFFMTPYAWNASSGAKDNVDKLTQLETEISFEINIWQKQETT